MRWIHRCICMMLGTLLGCCGDDGTPFEPEYGAPSPSVDIGGTVNDAYGKAAIPGIEVRLAGVDTVQTGANGRWSMTHYCADPEAVAQEILHFVDVDDDANGLFLPGQHALDPANIVGGAYVEREIGTTLYEDVVAEYGPPRATLETGE
jgi:hypothetical protein